MDILAPKMDKSLPFEKVQPQWQLLYLFSESVQSHLTIQKSSPRIHPDIICHDRIHPWYFWSI